MHVRVFFLGRDGDQQFEKTLEKAFLSLPQVSSVGNTQAIPDFYKDGLSSLRPGLWLG